MSRCTVAGSCRISIHALLAESDLYAMGYYRYSGISIHALLAESDGWQTADDVIQMVFLSTLSLRRATGEVLSLLSLLLIFLSTLSLRRATIDFTVYLSNNPISIHALLAESDSKSAQNSGVLLRI